jgi:hypothetical protein
MSLLIVLASLCLLMFVAYRSYSVILFAPIAALGHRSLCRDRSFLPDPNRLSGRALRRGAKE